MAATERGAAGRISRRTLLAGTGVGLGLLFTAAPSAHAATLRDGSWTNPALGYFPNGGHFGAPRGDASHAGQDITNSVGTAVYAAAAGTVIRRQWGGGLPGRTGNALVISHGGGRYTYYGHLDAYRVSLNQAVSAGQRIGDMGATGNVTGPHLHFEIHSGGLGSVVNPVPYTGARGVDLGGGWSALDPDARGQRVRAVQHLLNQRGHGLQADGWLGPTSTEAVKAFQRGSGLVADGQVGPLTWPEIVYSLSQGANGHHVRAVQTVLNKHSAGLVVDGDFGSVTNSAVRGFQSGNRLVVDGLAGAITWRALVG
ncbi:metalloendopeptidase [Saccharomonospora piscinae]|uniref:peptidoglycan DD-metalloendopeptidase family protein n=1 Tax=Saccharomonospora piscinae TaxID=687388 RepID=UPI001105C806|nr:peptidoglycan DD-metalloendopeptidase family protein [Saccharomonospora piscinae]TLW94698.1 metalloendopeptidase [Saccharomonospora piscinae]